MQLTVVYDLLLSIYLTYLTVSKTVTSARVKSIEDFRSPLMDSNICYLFVVIMSGFATIYETNVLTTMKVSNDTTIKTTMKTSTFGQNLNASIDTTEQNASIDITEQITTDKNKSEAVNNEVHAFNDTNETASLLSSAFPMTQNTSQTSFSVRMEDTTASGLGMLFSRGQTRTTIKVTSIRTSSQITNDKSTASVNQSSRHGSYFNLTNSQIETQTNTSKISVITAVIGTSTTSPNTTVASSVTNSSVKTTGGITQAPVVNSGQGSTTKATTVTTTTPKPINCPTGSCNGNETCFNTTKIGTSKKCAAGERCAVKESKTNGTSTYNLSCETQQVCDAITSAGTGACCNTDKCTPDLKDAQAKAKAGGGGNGSDYLRTNVTAFVCVAFLALKNIYGYI